MEKFVTHWQKAAAGDADIVLTLPEAKSLTEKLDEID